MNIIISSDEESLPWSRHENLLKEDLGHVQGRDDGNKASKFQYDVQILHKFTSLLSTT